MRTGMALATLFVTMPFVVRELIPILETMDLAEEEAARTMGASDWQVFWNVTLPNIRYGLLYGIILTNAVRVASCRHELVCQICTALRVLRCHKSLTEYTVLASCAFDCTQSPNHLQFLAHTSCMSQVVVLSDTMQAIYTVSAHPSLPAARICAILCMLSLTCFA